MSLLARIVICGATISLLAQPAFGQRGASNRPTAVPTPPPRVQAKVDSTRRAPTSGAVSLDFQDQDLKVVLDAIAAAGDLNVSLTNIPSQRVTLHLGRPVSRDSMASIIRTVAESNGLKVTASANIIEIAGTAPPLPVQTFNGRGGAQLAIAQELLQAQQGQQQLRLFTYRLKHASATQLAPVLTNLFAGAQGQGTRVTVPNGNGGFTTINTTPAAPAGTPGISNIPTPFGGGGGGGRGGRGGGAGGGAAAQLAIQEIDGALSGQTNDIRIIAEPSSNSLLIRATESDYALIQQIVSGIDLRPLQVLIEVTIAEVERTKDFDLGVSGNVNRTTRSGRGVDSASAPSVASAQDFILALTGGHGTVNYNVALSALQERGNVRVLSLPVIIAQNNQQAVLNVGSSRPFIQVSQTVTADPTARVETVQYIDVGTTLTITPTINPDGYVNMQVSQTDNSATDEVQFDAPVIDKREATTQIFIKDGQTTVIGGLAGKSNSSQVNGIPLLSRIPLIGPLLFGSKTTDETTTELFLFLTPHVIYNDADVDKLRNAVQNTSDLLKDVPITSRINAAEDSLATPADTTKKPKPWR